MPGAGPLKDRLEFQQRGPDDNGDRLGAFGAGFSRSAHILYLRGGEGVLQARLQGAQPVVLTVRSESLTQALTNAWRAVDARDTTRSFDLKSAPVPSKDFGPGYLDIVAEVHIGQDAG